MKIVYIDMDDTLCNYHGAYSQAVKDNPAIKYPQSQYGFFERLKPTAGAVEAVKRLIVSEHFDPFVLTSPSVRNPLCYTEKRVWIEKHFCLYFCGKLIICTRKDLLRGSYLIDNVAEGHGQELFDGELLHFGSDKYPNWESMMTYLGV